MPLNYRLTVPPTVEPVSLSLAKSQLRVDIHDDDLLIQTYISAAREFCEQHCNRAFFTQTWNLFLDSFPYGDYRTTVPLDQRSPWNYSAYWNDLAIRLPKPSLLSVTSIAYVDSNGDPQTLDPVTNFYVDPNSEPARLTPLAGATWPLTQFYQPGSIVVTYQSGSFVSPTFQETLVTIPAGTSPSKTWTSTLSKLNLGIVAVLDAGNSNAPVTEYTTAIAEDANGNATNQTVLTINQQNFVGPSVTVQYAAGICPSSIMLAMLLIIAHLYEHREANTELNLKNLPLGVEAHLRHWVFETFGNYSSGY